MHIFPNLIDKRIWEIIIGSCRHTNTLYRPSLDWFRAMRANSWLPNRDNAQWHITKYLSHYYTHSYCYYLSKFALAYLKILICCNGCNVTFITTFFMAVDVRVIVYTTRQTDFVGGLWLIVCSYLLSFGLNGSNLSLNICNKSSKTITWQQAMITEYIRLEPRLHKRIHTQKRNSKWNATLACIIYLISASLERLLHAS